MEHGSSHRKPAYPIHSLFVDRWSPRAMSGEALSETELMTLFEAARWAPSCGNFQPWRFLYARRDTDFWPAFLDLLNPSNKVWAARAGALVRGDLAHPLRRRRARVCHPFLRQWRRLAEPRAAGLAQ